VARTSYVRVAQRQEEKSIKPISGAAYAIEGCKEGPLVPPEPGRGGVRATRRLTFQPAQTLSRCAPRGERLSRNCALHNNRGALVA
jgi:hypothetical protein